MHTTDALSGKTSFSYDVGGRVVLTENALGRVIKIAYDEAGHKIAMDDPAMGHWEYAYNAYSELTHQRDPRGKVVDIDYDQLGRVLSERQEARLRRGFMTKDRTPSVELFKSSRSALQSGDSSMT